MTVFLFVLAYLVLGVICEYTLYRIDRKVFPDTFVEEHTHISLHEVLFGFYNKGTLKEAYEITAYRIPLVACRIFTVIGFGFCLCILIAEATSEGKLDNLKDIKVRIK